LGARATLVDHRQANKRRVCGACDVSPGFPPLRAGVRWLIDARCWRS
jgi:hypothetical protein